MNFQLIKIDTLPSSPDFWVVLSLFLVFMPHFQRFPIWISTTILFLFIWRISAIDNKKILPGKWLLAIIAISSCTAIAFYYGTILGKTAGTAFLSILLAIKLLESRNKRDYMLLIGISFFIIITNFLFSQTIPTVIYMFITVIILVMSMISIDLDNLTISLKKKLKISATLTFQALPLMLILFVLFPRIPGPLWELPNDSKSARSGLSDSMSPGNISQLIQSNDVAFRVKFKNKIPPQNKLYWRAMVFWYFDGRTWGQGKPNLTPSPIIEGSNKTTEYMVTLEPHDQQYLFALDMPASVPENSTYNANFLLRSKNKIESLYQYNASSYLSYRIQNKLSIWEASAGLKIPPISNPKTTSMAKEWKRKFSNPVDIVNHALDYFNKNEFIYTLRPPLTPGFNSVDQFLFETRKGFCEHYSSSFTLLMRAAGIPARVVIGYQGGEINPINQYLTVRQSDAHAWSEVWLQNKGWVRVDPTFAIAPERIEKDLNSALSSNDYRPFHMHLDNSAFKNLMLYWDAVDNSWKQWVIGYDSTRQNELLSSIFNKKMSFYDIIIALISILFITTLIITFYLLKSKPKVDMDPVQKIYAQFCSKLSKKGLTRKSYEGPVDFSLRATKSFPKNKASIELITQIYINFRFKSKHNDKLSIKMKQMVKSLKFE
jgi:protein-glutamine gamma-glutamyltransferase